MKRKDLEVRLTRKRTQLIERTALAVHVEAAEAEVLLSLGRHQSLRLNWLRITDDTQTLQDLKGLGWSGQHYAWLRDGYSIDKGLQAVRDSHLVEGGQLYIQNAASWLPVLALDPQPGETILDMCAAPGGKASHIAALTDNQAELWVNDNSHPRLAKLKANFKRLNVQPAGYTLYDARYLSKKLAGRQFDKILLDAPCSGEGMLTITIDKDVASWSVAQIKRLESLQKQLIQQAWQLLKPGGTLIYSTCTIAPEENEAVVDYLLRKHGNARLKPLDITLPNRVNTVVAWNNKQFDSSINNCLRLKPSSQLEAFFVAKIHKSVAFADIMEEL